MRHHDTPLLDAALATLFVFAAHHAYGAVHYGTIWRMHGALLALPLALLLVVSAGTARRRSDSAAGQLARALFLALVLVTIVLGIGVFEGLYNHALKDVLFVGGAPHELLVRLFPPPRYQLPDDLWFELSGVLQVLPAAWTAEQVLATSRRAMAGEVRP